MKRWAICWRKTGTQAEFIAKSFLDETEHLLRLKDKNLARWRELCILGTWKVSGVPQGTQFLSKEGTGRVRSFLKGLREVKGLAGQSSLTLFSSTPRAACCCPLNLCRREGHGGSQACRAMVKLGVSGETSFSGGHPSF